MFDTVTKIFCDVKKHEGEHYIKHALYGREIWRKFLHLFKLVLLQKWEAYQDFPQNGISKLQIVDFKNPSLYFSTKSFAFFQGYICTVLAPLETGSSSSSVFVFISRFLRRQVSTAMGLHLWITQE